MSGGLPELPDTSRAVFSKRTLLKTLRSLRRSVSASHAEAQDPVIIPVNTVIRAIITLFRKTTKISKSAAIKT